jgi:hypothetical protein
MMKIFSLFLTLTLSLALFSQKVFSDPNVEKRSVSGFHGVSVSGNIELFLTQGEEESVAVSAANTKWRDKIITEVKNGVLYIYWKNKEDQKGIYVDLGNKKLRAYVAVKDIDYLSASGSGGVHIEGKLNADQLKIKLSGSGSIKGDISVKDLTVGLSGSGHTNLSGTAERSSFSISGSGSISSYDLLTDFCKISSSGSGSVLVTVNKEISARTSGSGSVYVKGGALIRDIHTSGSGRLKKVS